MGITNRQLLFMHYILIIPFTCCTISKLLADTFATGSWLFIIGATAIYCFAAGIIAYLGYLFKNQTLFEYSQLIAGKFASYCISILYMINFFVFFSLLLRSVSEIIKSELLVNTPIWATMLVMIIAAGYAASKGLSNIGRIIEIIGLITLLSALIIHFLMFCSGDILNTRPFLNFSEPSKYITSFPLTLYLFSGFEIMTIIPFKNHNGKKAIGAAMLSILLIGLSYIMIFETCCMVLGIESISNYSYPLIPAMRKLDITALQFLKRIDLLFIIAWLLAVFASSAILLFGTAEYARKILSKPGNNKILIAVCLIGFIFGLVPKSDISANQIVLYYCYYASGIIIFIIP
ncbi:MAG: GerAB/ArcD/ProY family transporter [Ignavibacteriaceae bacterium]|nr:GerAB/ArcD/ProY family transporter [Ignavibacteriaceae bacterium]